MEAKAMVATTVLLAALGSMHMGQARAQTMTAADSTSTARALFDEYWQWQLREYPEFATQIGDGRYNDRLSDQSAAAVDKRRAMRADFRERLAKINLATLSPVDRVSVRILRYGLDQAVALDKLCAPLSCSFNDFWSPITQLYGPQFEFPQLVDATRFTSVRDYEAYIKRLNALPTQFDQLIARMELGIKLHWMPARIAIARVPEQLDGELDPDPAKSPAYKPFLSFPADVATVDRERLTAAGRLAIKENVIPAFCRLREFYAKRYLPAARESIAASTLPPGAAYYNAALALLTTTRMSPKEIHELGLSEVSRIGKEMDATMIASGFKGTRSEFQTFLNTDPRFFYSSREDMLSGYRDIAKRADAEMPRFFAELPRLPYGIRAMRPEEGDNPEHYVRGAEDGSRAAYFEANVNSLSRRAKWTMETLLLHEAVPGHHLQIARAQEMKNLPEFRRHSFFVAHIEGWGLYAESLGYEMGFYTDPYSKFGNLSSEMHRAARLVVDTGIHAFGWTREQAIDYLIDNAALTRQFATAEVDRYIVIPGQATAYKVGELKIKALRARAHTELGERFDLRRFHNAVIDNGALPLDVLEEQVNDWIGSERARTK